MHIYSPHKGLPRRKGRSPWALELSGSSQSLLTTFIALLFLAGGMYLYSVNRSAVQGYEMRSLEKKLEALKKANGELRVEEAEKSSLSRVEAGSQNLRMEKASLTETLVLGNNAVAVR